MVVHYLVNKNKMPEAGTYFDLVVNRKTPVEKAMVQAFDMSPTQMEETVKTYFSSLSGLGIALDQAKKPVQLRRTFRSRIICPCRSARMTSA